MENTNETRVIVVGAGPAGLLLALLLAQRGIHCQVLEQAEQLDEQPRATHYASPAVQVLRRAGILDEVFAMGFQPDSVCWRKLDGSELAELKLSAVADENTRMTCLPLDKLRQILVNHCKTTEKVTMSWGHRVTATGQDEKCAWVDVASPTGPKRLQAPYIVGCDGANSYIRRALFGDDFPGKTWDKQVVATNVYYDFSKYNYKDTNFIIHPDHWHMAARISRDGLWRVTYGETPGQSTEELKSGLPAKFEKILPGHPKPDQYKVVYFSPYKVHQRVVSAMRVGCVLLAADAAHLCNPFGGLGLTSGLVDVGGLSDCLYAVHSGLSDATILDTYSTVRREKFNRFVDPISSDNFRLLFSNDPDTVLDHDQFLQMCKRRESDAEFAAGMQLRINSIGHNFLDGVDFKAADVDTKTM